MTAELLTDITIFVLALLVGFEVISKVPATLHTPLMSAANSIHGIVLAGAMLIAVTADNALGYILAFVAAAFAAMNVVGGYVVTGRMLKMFRRSRAPVPAPDTPAVSTARAPAGGETPSTGDPAAACAPPRSAVLGLHLMNSRPRPGAATRCPRAAWPRDRPPRSPWWCTRARHRYRLDRDDRRRAHRRGPACRRADRR